MPASPTRPCASCGVERAIADFRDPGDVQRGRPPKFCRYCRAESLDLQERQRRNRSRRPSARARQRGYAARDSWTRHLATVFTHPTGFKVCPPVSGCGEALPIEAFVEDRYQQDGLSTRCASCLSEEVVA